MRRAQEGAARCLPAGRPLSGQQASQWRSGFAWPTARTCRTSAHCAGSRALPGARNHRWRFVPIVNLDQTVGASRSARLNAAIGAWRMALNSLGGQHRGRKQPRFLGNRASCKTPRRELLRRGIHPLGAICCRDRGLGARAAKLMASFSWFGANRPLHHGMHGSRRGNVGASLA